jgi:4-diphosphocytidyl-2-C-methyl-D-erythritol kinase
MIYRTYAKINLTLEVLGKRSDGYHDLASLTHTIGLADDLYVEPADEILTRVEGLELIQNNLVTRAAHVLAAETYTRAGAELTLVKRIPTAAGLGGGSSNAATSLVALNRLWQTRLGYHALMRLAAQLGSDVPFFVRGGAAVLRGRGDDLQPLAPLPVQWLMLAIPEARLTNKTATLYDALLPSDFSSGAATAALAARLAQGGSLDNDGLVNAFARPARAVFPGLGETWQRLEASTGQRFHLSGAGPALFTLASDRADARRLANQANATGMTAYAVRTVRHARVSVRLNERARIEYP